MSASVSASVSASALVWLVSASVGGTLPNLNWVIFVANRRVGDFKLAI